MVDVFERILGYSLNISQIDFDSRSETAQIVFLHDRLVREGLMPKRSEPTVLRGPMRTFSAALRARYQPDKHYPGPVQLLLADDDRLDQHTNQRNHEHAVEGWKQWAPNIVYTHAPGNHMTMLKQPHVYDLVKLLKID
jgi:thioesterase domain-containing protein